MGDTAPGINNNSVTTKNEEADAKPKLVSLKELFSFARTCKSRLCIAGAALSASVSGSIVPATAYYFAAASGQLGASTDSASFMESIREQAYAFMILGALILVTMTVQATLMEMAAAEMTMTLKEEWFRALLRQDIAYYDIMDVAGEGSIITINSNKYRKGVGKKFALGIQFFVTFTGSLGFSLYSSWQVTLMVLAIGPMFYVSALFVVKMNSSVTARATASYAKAGSIVQATVSNIRTVLSLNAVDIMVDHFKEATKTAYDGAVSQFGLLGFANGSIMASMMFSFYVITLFGAFLLYDQVRDEGCDPSGTVEGNEECDPSGLGVFSALLGMTFGAAVLPQVSATVESLVNARVACYPAFAVMHRTSCGKKSKYNAHDGSAETAFCRGGPSLPAYIIDSSSNSGKQLQNLSGEVEFKNVTFSYPTRKEAKVLNGFSLKIAAGKTVALVGASGGGKSTVVQLMERFYDPLDGTITLDGVDVRELNVKWLRNTIALVQQEPKLFECSIRTNIAMGSPGATDRDIEDAARMANAHDFILSFPNGYDTDVGALGDQLSGGQRQRICIARSLVKHPKILLLDESTSALDSESEGTVQQALDDLIKTQNMTTFVIAHRLSTIRNADLIAVVDGGLIVEQGTHNELLEKQSHYFRLVQTQNVSTKQSHQVKECEASTNGLVEGDAYVGDTNDIPVMIEFAKVNFEYPSRPGVAVLNNFDLKVRQGETLALVGSSGSGKSTTIQLMECFYRPTSGQVKFKGVDAAELNVRWLRDQIGLVSQQPVLFDCSIEDNIRYGLPDASHEQVVEVAKQANAHTFIMEFPDGYATRVGQGSTLISGGQKQRICIARALIKKPSILLLDEATSALDSKSEKVVQEALDQIMRNPNQTCIVIAHRLSTIAGADRIAVVDNGKICEIGNHDKLMGIPYGRYRRFQSLQSLDEVASDVVASQRTLPGRREDDVNVKKDEGMQQGDPDDGLKNDDEEGASHAKRARMLASGDGYYFFVGGVGALLAGLVFPMWGLCFAFMIEVFFAQVNSCPPVPEGYNTIECDEYWSVSASDIRGKSFKVSYGFLGIIVSALVGYVMLYWGFGVATERMNKRVRDTAFGSLVRQEVAWYDIRSPGAIASRLSDDAALLHAYAGEPIRTLVSALASVLVGVMLSFFFMWPFALLVLCIVPVMGWAAELEMQMYLGSDESDEEVTNEKSPGGIVVEALSNIRTIASLTLEEERLEVYKTALRREDPHAIRNNATKGATAGVGQFVQMWGMGLMFWWGGWLLVNAKGYVYRDFLISMFSLLFSLSGLSIAAEGAVDRSKAKRAAARVFELTDRRSLIDPLSTGGRKYV